MGGRLQPLAVAGLDLDSAWGFAGDQALEHVTEIRQTYPDGWRSRCIENQVLSHTSAGCGGFYVEHLGGDG